MVWRMSLSLLLSCHLALLRFCSKYNQPRMVLARPSSAWHLAQSSRYSCWPSASASAGRLAHKISAPRRQSLLNIGQVSLECDARHDRAGMALVLLAVLVLDVLVVAGQVDHGIGTGGLGGVLEGDQRRL